MNKYYTVRFDDICPTMAWQQFEKAIELMNYYNIKPLIGVIPKNKDADQEIDPPNPEFWKVIKALQDNGWEIAIHGLTHVYDQAEPKTILCGKKHSEFAGNSYEDQFYKIKEAKEIFEKNGVFTDIFFAPAHTYDATTLKALYRNGIRYISDGMSSRPYIQEGIKCIPCRSFGVPGRLTSRYNIAVCHPSEWATKKPYDFDQLKEFCEMNKSRLVDFSLLKEENTGNYCAEKIDEFIYVRMIRIINNVRQR